MIKLPFDYNWWTDCDTTRLGIGRCLCRWRLWFCGQEKRSSQLFACKNISFLWLVKHQYGCWQSCTIQKRKCQSLIRTFAQFFFVIPSEFHICRSSSQTETLTAWLPAKNLQSKCAFISCLCIIFFHVNASANVREIVLFLASSC